MLEIHGHIYKIIQIYTWSWKYIMEIQAHDAGLSCFTAQLPLVALRICREALATRQRYTEFRAIRAIRTSLPAANGQQMGKLLLKDILVTSGYIWSLWIDYGSRFDLHATNHHKLMITSDR